MPKRACGNDEWQADLPVGAGGEQRNAGCPSNLGWLELRQLLLIKLITKLTLVGVISEGWCKIS